MRYLWLRHVAKFTKTFVAVPMTSQDDLDSYGHSIFKTIVGVPMTSCHLTIFCHIFQPTLIRSFAPLLQRINVPLRHPWPQAIAHAVDREKMQFRYLLNRNLPKSELVHKGIMLRFVMKLVNRRSETTSPIALKLGCFYKEM